VPNGDKDVEPAVIVVVEEPSAETKHVGGRTCDSCLMTDVPEPALAVVVEHVIRILLKIGDEQVQPAIVIVVAQRYAHSCHGVAETRHGHPRLHADLSELPVVVVMEQICRQSIIGDEQVGPAVVVVVGGPHC